MANLNLQIISKEMIKPSSPTLHTHRIHSLSLIDQIQPPIYIPLIFFYKNESTLKNNQLEICRQLKQSLSDILTLFYPLAGKIHGNSSVDCNDAGAEFIEARTISRLEEVIRDPKMEDLERFLPVKAFGLEFMNVLLSIKITFFSCGGIAFAVCLSHKLADGASLMSFMKAWAVANCNSDKINNNFSNPSFDLAIRFPPKDMSGSNVDPITKIVKEKIITKRLVFDKEKIEKLKEVAASGDNQANNPTRVEAVSAFLWQRFIKATKDKTGIEKKVFAAVHAVDLRPRTNPPLSEHAFGNCCVPTITEFSETDNESDLRSKLVNKLRASIRSIDGEYVKEVQEGKHLNDHSSKIVDLFRRGAEIVGFTSWCRFPVYEVDFGWGKPIWVSTTTLPFKSLVVLMNTPCGDGIEAWVNVTQDHADILETR